MESLKHLVVAAQAGDIEAYGRLVEGTQRMACAVALGGYCETRPWRRMRSTGLSAGVSAALRSGGACGVPRVASTHRDHVALNLRRARRRTLLRLDDIPEVPVLDEAETRWSDLQRHRLASALLTLTPEERQLCDRRYHGQWTVARLARNAGVDDAAMRKRLQRIRDKLRKEIEMAEQRGIRPEDIRPDLPAKVVELLARPQLTDLPENPVGRTMEGLRQAFPDFIDRDLPEVVNLAEARTTIANDAMYVESTELHRIDEGRILRYDLTLPLLLTVRYSGQPLRVWASGKAYRLCQVDATHLEAFHQAEALWLDDRERLNQWLMTARVLQSVDRILPGRTVKIVPTEYAMCSQAWELEVESDGHWSEVLAWGVFTDRIVSHLGGDPNRHTAIGVGYGLERLAMICYGIDDIRKLDIASVA